MPTKQLMQHCNHCGRPTLHIQQTPNHLLHLVLTILTAGIWLIVWIFTKSTRPTCTVCGSTEPIFNGGTKLGLAIIVVIVFFMFISNIDSNPAQSNTTQAVTTKPDTAQAVAPKSNTVQAKLTKSSDLPIETRQKYLDAFLKNPDEVLGRLKSAISNEEWNKAITITEYYLPTKHPEIVKLHAAATNRKKHAISSDEKLLKQPQAKVPEQPQPKPAAKHNPTPAGNYIVQVASTNSLAGANLIANQLKELAYTPKVRTITTNNFTTYRVFTEPFNDKEHAIEAKKHIDRAMGVNGLVLPIKND